MILLNTNAKWATQLKVNSPEFYNRKEILSNYIAGLERLKKEGKIQSYDNFRVDKDGIVHFSIQPVHPVKMLICFNVAI
jgi:hypothetical protein